MRVLAPESACLIGTERQTPAVVLEVSFAPRMHVTYKVGFWDSENDWTVEWLEACCVAAADDSHHLSVRAESGAEPEPEF
jgi:hypothetical protein